MINPPHGLTTAGHRRTGSDTPTDSALSSPTGQRLLRDIARPVHSGIVGTFANDWLREAFLEALIADERLPDVVATRHDLDRIFCGQSSSIAFSAFADRLQVFPTLEETIEHLEAKADNLRAGQSAPTTVWFAVPGNDTDVISQTIEYWSGLDLTVLFLGFWPHGSNRHPRPARSPAFPSEPFIARSLNDSIALLQAGG
ncbi:hypothetical protein [Actinomadura hibisca]|uniref:hypothetical protein n=1 Tax=Actinomadura hibisca TaxID=68565 RepID=UPI00083681B2|nr:hypothetical protein [Actinomadura hibisca]